MQPYFVPYMGYWQLMNAADRFVVYDDVSYIKGGWINRNRILVNGKPSYLTLPIAGASPNMKINQLRMQLNQRWVDKARKTIEVAYKKAPYFQATFVLIEDILALQSASLSEFLLNQIIKVANHLGIDTEIVPSSVVYANSELKAQQRVLDICRREKCDTYLNAIGGRGLYDPAVFAQEGVLLCFVEAKSIHYQQFQRYEFVSNLSIIDVLMFNGVDGVRAFFEEFNLICPNSAAEVDGLLP